jgi:hypothetical protein
LLTFHSFKNDPFIALPVGGMAAAPIELGYDNEVANPARHYSGQHFLSVKCRTELEEQLARKKSQERKAEKYEGNPKDNGYCKHASNGTAITISWR